MGFFGKELVLSTVERAEVYSLYALAVVAVVFTAAYITRLLVRVFHLPPLNKESEERHYHEAPLLMLIPYAILGLASIALGLAWLYVGYWVAAGVGETLSIKVTPPYMPPIDLTTIVITAVVLVDIIGVALLYLRRHSLVYLLERSSALRAIHSFLFNRWYVNSAIYYLFLDSFAGLSWLLNVINRAIDLFYHYVLPKAGELTSRGLRALFRGRTDYILTLYLFMLVVVGILIFVAWR